MNIIKVSDKPEVIEGAARWFHSKWHVPVDAYIESMNASLNTMTAVPMWYIIQDESDQIIAGLGVIENDFHKRPDLTPNICAVFVEEDYRKMGLAKALLDHACEELAKGQISDVYLLTTHTEFYERCGWEFHCMVEELEGSIVRMYHRKTK